LLLNNQFNLHCSQSLFVDQSSWTTLQIWRSQEFPAEPKASQGLLIWPSQEFPAEPKASQGLLIWLSQEFPAEPKASQGLLVDVNCIAK